MPTPSITSGLAGVESCRSDPKRRDRWNSCSSVFAALRDSRGAMTDRTGTPADRHAVISRVLAEHGRLDVADVAEQLGVAPETVRRDLKALESVGMLRRVHGGAIRVDPESRVPIPTLAAPSVPESAASARVWAELPRSGTVLIASGPLALAITHAVMAEPPVDIGLTVVTNSLDAAVHL